MDHCRCQVHSDGARYEWVKANCYHCLQLKGKGGKVTCALGYWDEHESVRAKHIEKLLDQESFYSIIAADCADFNDMRPEKGEAQCTEDGCDEIAHSQNQHRLLCKRHTTPYLRKQTS
jgi:hypothetical protein